MFAVDVLVVCAAPAFVLLFAMTVMAAAPPPRAIVRFPAVPVPARTMKLLVTLVVVVAPTRPSLVSVAVLTDAVVFAEDEFDAPDPLPPPATTVIAAGAVPADLAALVAFQALPFPPLPPPAETVTPPAALLVVVAPTRPSGVNVAEFTGAALAELVEFKAFPPEPGWAETVMGAAIGLAALPAGGAFSAGAELFSAGEPD